MGTLARLGSRLGQLARAVHRRGSGDSLGVLAAGLTYYAFLSLFPLLLLGLSMLGFLLAGNPAAQTEWVTRLTGSIPGLSGLVGRNLQAVVGGRVGTGVVGLVGAAWTASSLTGATENALSTVFRTRRAGLVGRHLRALGLMAGLGLLAVASTFVTGFATAWSGGGVIGDLLRALGGIAGVAVDLGFLLVAYGALTPGRELPMRAHLPGAILMTLGWTLLKIAGSWTAVRVVAHATALYGAVGAAFGLIAILSIAVRLFLYGAELSAVLLEEREGGSQG